MKLDNEIIKINLYTYQKSFLDLDVNDVKTNEIHYKNTYTIVNSVEIKNYTIEEILIKFQMANLLRIDGIESKAKAYEEFSEGLDDFNGMLVSIDKIKKVLHENIGKTFLRKIKLDNEIKRKFIYQTKDNSIYFKTYILVCKQEIFQIEFIFYEEENSYFRYID